MMDKLKRILWWMAWLLLLTATIITKTGNDLVGNGFYIATLIAFIGYMTL